MIQFLILTLLAFSAVSAPDAFAKLEFNKVDKSYDYTYVTGIGYHFDYSELGGTAGISHGPLANLKLMIDNEGAFIFPDATFGVTMGLDQTTTSLALGLGIGGTTESGTGVWVGAKYQSYISYKTSPAAIFRIGAFFPVGEKGENRWDIELGYGSFNVEALTTVKHYPMLTAQITYGFL